MWQPRGLNYPLYSVLSRHHSEGNDFSLSFLQLQKEAARSATPPTCAAPSAAADAGDGVANVPTHALLRGGASSSDGRGGVPEAAGVATDTAVQCRPSASSTRRALALQDEGEAGAQAAFLQGGAGFGDGTPDEPGARGSAEGLHAAAAAVSPRDAKVAEEPQKQPAQHAEEGEEGGDHQEETQQHQQEQRGDQRKQVRHQQQTQVQQGQGEQQEEGARQPQKEQREEQEGQQQGVQEQRQNERHFLGNSPHLPATAEGRTAALEPDQATEGSSAELNSSCCGAATPDDGQGRTVEGREACEQTTAATSTTSSTVSRLCCPVARPSPRLSSPSIQTNTSTSESSSEGSVRVPQAAGDACVVPSPVSGTPVSAVTPASGALTAAGGARGSLGESLSRLPSLRRSVVPSFRVLILFGSTSGVSAAVAFSIFHTLVHRLLSSSKLMQGGCIQDRAAVAAVSPPAVGARGAAADCAARSPDAEAASASASPAASFPSPVAAGSGGHASGNSPSSGGSETGERRGAADARSRTSSCVSVESGAPCPRDELRQKSSRGRGEEFPARSVAEASKYFSCAATGTGEELTGEDLLPQREELQQQRAQQQQWTHQGDCDGKTQRRSHEQQQKEKGHTREERHSERQWQQFCQRSGQQQTQQQDQQQWPQQNSGASDRQSVCLEEDRSPVSVRCVFPVKREFISEKREAAAQAAEVASMGLKAAAAVASAALKIGEQHAALRRAAATACETSDDGCGEEPKIWFLDEMQIGRVGVFIQSMQYLTLQDFLEFAEQSRAASAAATAAAAREGADTYAAGQVNCSADAETVGGNALFAGATHAQELSKPQRGETGADAGARGCLCGNTSTSISTNHADQGDSCGSASAVGTFGCCTSATSSVAAGDVTAGGSRTTTEVLTSIPHTLVLYCISTDTGGAPPESAAPFFSELLEAADDFRVSRGSLQGCCVAGVGCGSTDYPHSTFCKPARQLMTPLQRLGAQVLMQQPLLLLTDTSAAATTEMKLAKWRQHLMQQIECLLQAGCEEDVQRLLRNATSTASLREKQQRQHRRQQQQQQRSSPSLKDDREACGGVTEGPGTRAVEENRRKPAADPQHNQGCGLTGVNEVFKRDGSLSQESTLDFGAVTDSSLASGSDEQSATDDESSFFDDDEDFSVDEASPLPVSKRLNSSSGKSRSFAGVGSAGCGDSGGEDVEDVVGGEASDESGAEHNTGSTNLPQVKRPQADLVDLSNRRRKNQSGAEMTDLASQVQRRDRPKRALRAGGPTSAGEGRERHERGGGSRHVERTREKMVKPRHAEQLSKEGYRLIGSHSAVKLCRWTKSQLRGRGGCYKHTFYGITSSQCMEMTPSLACANKCVFCWRHHKNPVGTSWRWQMDDEKFVVEEAITQHFKAIKELKGMAEVKQDRLDAARTNIRHCALSLVGEPIMYPRIAALVKLLHEKHISTFMVTNAQFPDALASLPPVTQLYLSVDAASPEALKAIDQPLFKDYWERFMKCMDILRSKRQRTVYRLTLVAGYNMPDLAALEQTQSEVPSEAHHGGRQQTDTTTPRPPSSEDPPECHPLPTRRATLAQAERGSDDAASHSGCACGDAAACRSRSPAGAPRAVPPPSTASTPPSGLNQEVDTEGRGKGHSRTVGPGGGEDMRGRSAAAYAALVLKGLPDFIEVKAATYAGTSKHSKITMKNIPWHDQVVAFCKDLCAALPKGDYELACVHRHSCCVLIAKTEYKKENKWHTWIDYEKFYELAASGRTDFAGTDYCAPTPDWATFGHIAAGFSPHEARIYTKGKQKRLQGFASTAGVCHV